MVELWDPLNLLNGKPEIVQSWRIDDINKRILKISGPANLVMVAHKSTIDALTFELTPFVGVMVLRPDESRVFEVVGTVNPGALVNQYEINGGSVLERPE